VGLCCDGVSKSSTGKEVLSSGGEFYKLQWHLIREGGLGCWHLLMCPRVLWLGSSSSSPSWVLWGGSSCDRSLFSPLFPLFLGHYFNTITTKGGKLPTNRHYSGIPRHCSLLGHPGHYGLIS